MLGVIKRFKSIIPEFIWEYFRLRSILKSHAAVASYWDEVLDDYAENKISKFELKSKKVLEDSERIIWQYWGQGVEDDKLPELVKKCFESVDKYKGEYRIIRLSDATLGEYLDLPDHIVEKYRTGVMGATHFSDVVRVALLSVYGGVWLDATILLTAPLTDHLCGHDWFMYQRDENQEDKKKWRRTYAYYFGWHKDFKVRVLNSVIFAKRDSTVIDDWFQLLSFYWSTKNFIIDYFFFQILACQYLQRFPQCNCHVVSDCLPNMLQCYFTGSYTKYSIPEILSKENIHKLSYKTVSVEQLREVIR